MELISYVYIFGIPLMAYLCYRWGFQEGVECAVNELEDRGLLNFDEEDLDSQG